MNIKYNPKLSAGCLTLYVIVALIISYRATASLNPMTVYSTGSLGAKIAVTVLAVLTGLGLLQMVSMYWTRKFIETTAGQPADDIICPGCGRPLLQFGSAYGTPMKCPRCGKWWHNGPACYNMVPPGTSMIHLCPHCIASLSGDQDLFDENAFPTIK